MAAPVVNTSNLATGTSSTLSSGSITIGGANRVLYAIVMVADGSPASVTSVDWTGGGGEALTQIADSGTVQTFLRTYVYRRIAPTATTGTVDLVLSAAQSQVGLLTLAIEDCDQTTPNGTGVFADGSGSTPDATVVVSSATGKLVLDFLQRVSSGTLTAGGGQTQLQQGAVANVTFAGSSEAGASSVTMSWDGSATGTVSAWQWVIGALSLNEVAAGGTPVGLATETDTALALSSPPPVGRADETDRAVTLAGVNFAVDGDLFLFGDTADDESSMGGLRVFGGFVASGSSAPTGRSDETDLALARAGVQIRAAGLAAETDTALARAAVSIRAAGLSSETDAALQLAGVQLRAVGRADEIDAALTLGAGGTPVGLAAETDLALGLAPVAIRATGLAAETDTALARAALQIRVTGLAAETDTALGLTSGASGPVGVAAETDAAFGLTARQIGATGRADEADASLNLTAVSVRATGLGAETDAALALTPVQQGAAGRADETDAAFALLASGPQPVGLAVETDEAFALLPGRKTATLGGHKRKRIQLVDELEELQEVSAMLAQLFDQGVFHG